MHDLRQKALLESGKKLSRKARSRQATPMASPGPSRQGSRVPSRYASEDEDAADSEAGRSHASSYAPSEISDEEDFEQNILNEGGDTEEMIEDNLAALLDRKGAKVGTQVRASRLLTLGALLRQNYCKDNVDGVMDELLPQVVKSARGGPLDEIINALKALQALAITVGDSSAEFDESFQPLKVMCETSEQAVVKIEALRTMGVATVCGGDEPTAEDLLQFTQEIVQSDGSNINAPDNGPVVAAALNVWGFVASTLDDISVYASMGMDAFIDQLDSTDIDVQVAAGEVIALIFEAGRVFERQTGESWDLDFNKGELIKRMKLLTKESSRGISKKNRKHLHQSFQSVITSLETARGPKYSTAQNQNDDGASYGYREKVRLGDDLIVVDSWALSARIDMLKSMLKGGLGTHYQENPTVKELLKAAKAIGGTAIKVSKSHNHYQVAPRQARAEKLARQNIFVHDSY